MDDKKGTTFLLGMGLKSEDPATRTFKLMITDTTVLNTLRNTKQNKDNVSTIIILSSAMTDMIISSTSRSLPTWKVATWSSTLTPIPWTAPS